MMRKKDRVLVFLSTFFIGMLGVFFFGTIIFYIFSILALIYVFIGGKIHGA
jgi:hypothetical protein